MSGMTGAASEKISGAIFGLVNGKWPVQFMMNEPSSIGT
jgi:hypothetical protein